jgi:thiamine-phosphate pyrophosphorylase
VLLTLVTDRRQLAAGRDLVSLATEAASAGVDMIQIREKDLDGRDLFETVVSVLGAVTGTRTEVFVNGRVDVAVASAAHRVQLPDNGLPVGEVKRAFPALVVGASRHSVEGALQAEAEGADFVLLGPIFATPGKEDRALGLRVLDKAASRVAIPVHAIGGIVPGNARQVIDAGAHGLAAIRAFLESPGDAVRAFRASS